MAEQNGKPKVEAEKSGVLSAENGPADRFPELKKYVVVSGPWTEAHSRWFETMTGEKDTFLEERDPGL